MPMIRSALPCLVFLGLALAGPVQADPAPPDEPWFVDIAAEMGLGEVAGKTPVLTDLDGDGWWDLVLDHRRFYRRDPAGGFVPQESHGIPQPVVRHVPFGKDGQPDLAKAKERPFVPQALYFADIDGDGHVDALQVVRATWERIQRDGSWAWAEAVDHGQRSRVFLGDGTGRFRPGPESAWSTDEARGAAMALAIVDVDADGLLDLYEGREYRQYGVLVNCGIDRLWKGDGNGGFKDITRAAGLWTVPEPGQRLSSRPSYGVTAADLDNNGWPDLLQMAYGRQWNLQWRNDGAARFSEIGRETGFAGDAIQHGRHPEIVRQRMGRRDERPFRSNGNTFDCAVGDIDNDGDLDCFLGEIAHWWAGESSDRSALLRNRGPDHGWTFERVDVGTLLPPRERRQPTRWNEGDLHVAFFDMDNDMRLDLLIGSGDYPDGQFLRLYRQKDDGTFVEVTQIGKVHWEGCGGISLGDIDRDGDVDIVAGRSFMRLGKAHRDAHMEGITLNRPAVFRNDIANLTGHHWLNVRLQGKGAGGCNRAGIGARVLVTAGGVTQMREIRCGSGLSGHQDPPEACFGLAGHDTVERLEVRWGPGRPPSVFRDVKADRFVRAVEGEATLKLAE